MKKLVISITDEGATENEYVLKIDSDGVPLEMLMGAVSSLLPRALNQMVGFIANRDPSLACALMIDCIKNLVVPQEEDEATFTQVEKTPDQDLPSNPVS